MKKLDDLVLERIKEAIDPYCSITGEQLQKISPFLEVKSYSAQQIIKPVNSEEKTVRFVLEGKLGLFYFDNKKEICDNIFTSGYLAFDLLSYLEKKVSSSYLITLTPCKVVEFHRDRRIEILQKVPEFSELSRAFLKREYVYAWERIRLLKKSDME
ncbi:cyclic nucleotide-binding domain-containing protein [Litoribacter populi]|uniref:hypothetical protein n=1 Tax=Litoribacter populi TaxID=2598460 RepID=UPI00117D12EF|nr:hypothetical protein [Litoribacter populi]